MPAGRPLVYELKIIRLHTVSSCVRKKIDKSNKKEVRGLNYVRLHVVALNILHFLHFLQIFCDFACLIKL